MTPPILRALPLGLTLLVAGAMAAESPITPPPRFLPDQTVQQLWTQMPPASDRDLEPLGDWQAKVYALVPRQSLHAATIDLTLPLLQTAVDREMSALEFFADPAWRGERAMFVPGPVLMKLADHFDMRAVFFMRGPDEDGKLVRMEWLILGRSQMIIKYDRPCIVHHHDYDYYTGKYEYRRFVHMNVGAYKQRLGIFHIKGANAPQDELEWLQGPLNADVKNFVIVDDRKLRCEYSKIVGQEQLVPLHPIRKLEAAGQRQSACLGH